MEDLERQKRQPWILLALLVVVALVLRLPNIDQSIWFDEACMTKQRTGTFSVLITTLYTDIHPPSYYLFLYGWNNLFGDSELSIRMPPLLCGLASLPLTYIVGRRLVGRSAAGWAVLLLCLSPVHLWYSIEARIYMPVILLVLAAVELFHRLFEPEPGRRTWWLYALAILGISSVHYYVAAYAVLLLGLGWILGRARAVPRVGRRIVILNGIALALLAVWVVVKFSFANFSTSESYLRPFTLSELYRFLFQWCWTGNCIPAGLRGASWEPRWWLWIAFQALGVILVIRGLWWVLRSRGERRDGPYIIFYLLAIPAFLLVLPWLGRPNTYIERSALPALPFLFLLAGAGLSSITRRGLRIGTAAATLLFFAGSLVAYYHYDDEWTVYKQHPDWRSAAAYLGDEIDDGASGRPIFSSYVNARSLAYYDDRIQDARNLAPSELGLDRAERTLVEKLGQGVGGALAGWANNVAAEFERTKANLRAGAELMVYHTGRGRVVDLKLEERNQDGTFYLLVNHYLPAGDQTVANLAANPLLQLVEQKDFRALTVYKMEVRRGQ